MLLFFPYYTYFYRILSFCNRYTYYIFNAWSFNNVLYRVTSFVSSVWGNFPCSLMYELRNDSTSFPLQRVSGSLVYASRNFEALLQGETDVFVMQPKFNAESNFWYEDVLLSYVFLRVPWALASTSRSGNRSTDVCWIEEIRSKFSTITHVGIPASAQAVQREVRSKM